LLIRSTYISVVNGTIMIPRQGRNHDPPNARSNAIGRAIQAKSRKNREKAANMPVKQPELLGLVLVLIASPPEGEWVYGNAVRRSAEGVCFLLC
jgi:hypothetical protein